MSVEKVFLSSTSRDLAKHRAALIATTRFADTTFKPGLTDGSCQIVYFVPRDSNCSRWNSYEYCYRANARVAEVVSLVIVNAFNKVTSGSNL
jgi:hypothetical protein